MRISEGVAQERVRKARELLGARLRARRAACLLTEFESKQILAVYGLPTVATRVAATAEEAVAAAEAIGYPVVLKLLFARR